MNIDEVPLFAHGCQFGKFTTRDDDQWYAHSIYLSLIHFPACSVNLLHGPSVKENYLTSTVFQQVIP